MSQADFKIVSGPYSVHSFESLASATAINAGEPVENVAGAATSGAAGANAIVAMADNNPVIATDIFVGISNRASTHTSGAAGTCEVAVPVPELTRIRGKAETAASMDTAAELTAILFDTIEVALTGGVYTFLQTATANAAGFQIKAGNITKGTLDCTATSAAMRGAIA